MANEMLSDGYPPEIDTGLTDQRIIEQIGGLRESLDRLWNSDPIKSGAIGYSVAMSVLVVVSIWIPVHAAGHPDQDDLNRKLALVNQTGTVPPIATPILSSIRPNVRGLKP